jgi:hypothetical protein
MFDNLMKPINAAWKKVESHASDRLAFMLMRQTRTLPETVPLAPEILASVLRGWYVAKLLGRVKEESGEIGQGPRLSVFNEDPIESDWDTFSYPLYLGQKVVSKDEYPAVVLASVGIALAKCSDEQSMKPFAPYRSLKLLGGVPEIYGLGEGFELEVSETLHNWILDGQLSSEFAPIPNPKRAGEFSMSWEERKESVIAFFNAELLRFEDSVVNLPPGKKHDTLVWELRREIKAALNELVRMVNSVKKTYGGV